jgi:hypothetical protein
MIPLTDGVGDSNLVVTLTYIYHDQYGEAVLRVIRFSPKNPEQYEQFSAARLAVRAEESA